MARSRNSCLPASQQDRAGLGSCSTFLAGACRARRALSRSASSSANCDVTNSRRSSSRTSSIFSRGGSGWPSQHCSCSSRVRRSLCIGSKPNTPCRQQAFGSVHVSGPFGDQYLAFPGQPPFILFRRRRRLHHRTDSSLPARPAHQRPQQFLDVDPVGLDPPAPPVDLDRCGVRWPSSAHRSRYVALIASVN